MADIITANLPLYTMRTVNEHGAVITSMALVTNMRGPAGRRMTYYQSDITIDGETVTQRGYNEQSHMKALGLAVRRARNWVKKHNH